MTAAALPPLVRIKREDVTDAPEWFEQFLDQLNTELEFLRDVFDGGITLVGNGRGILKEVEIRTRAGYATPGGEFTLARVKTGLKHEIVACDVKQVFDLDDPDAVLSGSMRVDWRAANGEVRIRWVDGLRESRRYWVRLHIW